MVEEYLFSIKRNPRGLVGIKYIHVNGVVVVVAHSPYASPRSKIWLEHKLIKIYAKYYKKVTRESMGIFLNDESTVIKLPKEEL